MAEFSRYLPLSHREQRDESAVTNNWSAYFSSTLAATITALRALTDDQWHGPSVRHEVTVAELIATEIADLSPRGSVAQAPATAADAADTLELLAAAARASTRRTKLPALTTAVVAAVDLATATGIEIHLDAIATGAVAVARSLRAPIGIRAVLTDNRFLAVDAEWSIGTGRVHHSTAASIVLFLFVRAGLPPSLENP